MDLQFDPAVNWAYQNEDGTIVVDNGFVSGTYHEGDNYVFGDAIVMGNGFETTVQHVPYKLNVGEVKQGHHTMLLWDMSQAVYDVIIKADEMKLLHGRDIDYFELEKQVLKRD